MYLPLQFWLLHCIFSLVLLNRSKFMSFLVYCCFFHLTLIFSKAIGPFLTLLGPRNLPSLSHQMYHWLSDMWETAFWCKNCLDDFYMSNPNPCFCAGSNHYFCRHVSLLISDNFSVEVFFPTAAFIAYFFVNISVIKPA